MIYKSNQIQFGRFPGGGLGCLVFIALAMAAAFYVLRGLYKLLWWASPALLVLALIINWRVYPRLISSWLDTLESKPIEALIQAAFAVIAFPFFSLWLLLKALGTKADTSAEGAAFNATPPENEFADFEEIDSRPLQHPNEPEKMEMPPWRSKDDGNDLAE